MVANYQNSEWSPFSDFKLIRAKLDVDVGLRIVRDFIEVFAPGASLKTKGCQTRGLLYLITITHCNASFVERVLLSA